VHAINFLQIRYGFHSIAVSKMDMIELIFVDPRMKVNGQYYCDVLLSQQMLPAIKHVAGVCLSFNKTTLHLIMQGHHCKKRRTSLV